MRDKIRIAVALCVYQFEPVWIADNIGAFATVFLAGKWRIPSNCIRNPGFFALEHFRKLNFPMEWP